MSLANLIRYWEKGLKMGCPAKKNPVFMREQKNLIGGTLFLFLFVAVFHACFPFMFVFLLYVIATLPDSSSPGPDLVQFPQ
jgi:hypothetical protein